MRDALNPTLPERISRLIRPDFARTVRSRRIAAAILVLLAGASAFRGSPDDAQRDVVVAVRDLRPGVTVSADDVAVRTRPAATVPDGAATALDAVVGATLAGPSRRGEVLTDARMLGSRLAALTVGPAARVVPVRLNDGAVLDLIRPGDVVDIIGSPPGGADSATRVVARDAIVVLVSPAPTALGGDDADRVVLVALPGPAANTLAEATLIQDVTVTIH